MLHGDRRQLQQHWIFWFAGGILQRCGFQQLQTVGTHSVWPRAGACRSSFACWLLTFHVLKAHTRHTRGCSTICSNLVPFDITCAHELQDARKELSGAVEELQAKASLVDLLHDKLLGVNNTLAFFDSQLQVDTNTNEHSGCRTRVALV